MWTLVGKGHPSLLKLCALVGLARRWLRACMQVREYGRNSLQLQHVSSGYSKSDMGFRSGMNLMHGFGDVFLGNIYSGRPYGSLGHAFQPLQSKHHLVTTSDPCPRVGVFSR